ncbi:MAG: hypothetical protein P8J87_14425 [Verrucomicrobiales bacterium]|nr:hypothetical protein [Verrucomicrobiales bacterium]
MPSRLSTSSATAFALLITTTAISAQNLQLSELLVSNNTSLLDEDGRHPDWIEIHNPSPVATDLAGYHLSDDPADLTKWPIPPRTVGPGGYLVVFATGLDRSSDPLQTNFKLGPDDGSINLLAPDGTSSRITFSPVQFADVSFGFSGAPEQSASPADHLQSPTPGAPNSRLLQAGPLIPAVTNNPTAPVDSALPIDATVTPRLHPVDTVSLYYRTMFGPEIELPMQPVDGVFRTTIPAAATRPGQMLRWHVVARDSNGNQTTDPPFPSRDRRNADQYYGTVGHDPALSSPLPVLHYFTTRPGQAEQPSGTRASVFLDNRFYDNVFIRQRCGAATPLEKRSFKIEFNDANHFRLTPGSSPVDEFNLNSTYTDKSCLRARLAGEF